MTISILIIEDDERIVRMLDRYFSARGDRVKGVADPIGAERVIDELAPDVVLLDWSLPGRQGIDVLRALRSQPRFAALPVIMLTAKSDELDRVEGLLTGADDFVSKPFSLAELDARITSVLRRTVRSNTAYHDGRLHIDPAKRKLLVDGAPVGLSSNEWTFLERLLASSFSVARHELMTAIWGEGSHVSERAIDNIVMRVRRVLGDDPETGEPYVATERGYGYRFARRRKPVMP